MASSGAPRVEVNHGEQQLTVTYDDGQEMLQISEAEWSLDLTDLAERVASRSRLPGAALLEPLRELRMVRGGPAATPAAPADVAPPVEEPGMQIWLRSLGGSTLGPYNTRDVKTVAQLKSRVFKDAQFPVLQQQIAADGCAPLPDVTRLDELQSTAGSIDLQLLLISPSPCRVVLRLRPPNRQEAGAPVLWRADGQALELLEPVGRKDLALEQTFDAVLDVNGTSEELYHHLADDLPCRALEGVDALGVPVVGFTSLAEATGHVMCSEKAVQTLLNNEVNSLGTCMLRWSYAVGP